MSHFSRVLSQRNQKGRRTGTECGRFPHPALASGPRFLHQTRKTQESECGNLRNLVRWSDVRRILRVTPLSFSYRCRSYPPTS